MSKVILLIHSRANSGKDTLAKFIKHALQNYKIGTEICPNSAKVKEVARNVFNWDGIKDHKGRGLLINITKAGYDFDPYYWDKINLDKINSLEDSNVFIVSDLRYESTYKYLKQNSNKGDLVLPILLVSARGGEKTGYSEDPSEQGLIIPFALVVKNDGTLMELQQKAEQIADLINVHLNETRE